MIGFTAGAERADQSLRPRCEDGATRFTCNVSLGGSSSREPRSDATCPDKPARVSMVESNGTRNPSRFSVVSKEGRPSGKRKDWSAW